MQRSDKVHRRQGLDLVLKWHKTISRISTRRQEVLWVDHILRLQPRAIHRAMSALATRDRNRLQVLVVLQTDSSSRSLLHHFLLEHIQISTGIKPTYTTATTPPELAHLVLNNTWATLDLPTSVNCHPRCLPQLTPKQIPTTAACLSIEVLALFHWTARPQTWIEHRLEYKMQLKLFSSEEITLIKFMIKWKMDWKL